VEGGNGRNGALSQVHFRLGKSRADKFAALKETQLSINLHSTHNPGIRLPLVVGYSEVGRRCVTKHPIRLGHDSLDVTLAYLKGKDAESEEAQEHANSSSLALYAQFRTSRREISS
jgi:hypothetical protein